MRQPADTLVLTPGVLSSFWSRALLKNEHPDTTPPSPYPRSSLQHIEVVPTTTGNSTDHAFHRDAHIHSHVFPNLNFLLTAKPPVTAALHHSTEQTTTFHPHSTTKPQQQQSHSQKPRPHLQTMCHDKVDFYACGCEYPYTRPFRCPNKEPTGKVLLSDCWPARCDTPERKKGYTLAVKCGEHREGEGKVNWDAKVDEREADGGELDEAVSVSEDEELGASEGGAEVGEVKNGVVENGDVEEGEIVGSSTEE
jgi:hypothetical protein